MRRSALLPLSFALAACASHPEAPRASATAEPRRVAAAHRYDAVGLEHLLGATETARAPEALRERARAAHDRAELFRFDETRAAETGNDEAVIRAQQARVEVARRGLAALETGAGDPDAELLFLRGELEAYLITDWRSGLLHGGAARRALEEALARDPGHAGARLAWAKQYYYLPAFCGGDPEECERLLRELIRDLPAWEPAWGFLGQVLRARGKAEEARLALLHARELDPRSPRAAWYLRREVP